MKAFFAALFGFLFMSPFNIAGDSMEPNFSDGNVVIIESATYDSQDPQRFDVIVFHGTDEPDKYFIKRIIGLPGETILLKEDRVFIVDEDGDENLLDESFRHSYTSDLTLRQIDGTTYNVPEGRYFVLGDNRKNSYDSRTWADPFIPKENIAGKYDFTLL